MFHYGPHGANGEDASIFLGDDGGDALYSGTKIAVNFNSPDYDITSAGPTTGSARNEMGHGIVARFSALLAEYRMAPEVTRRRIYIETLQDVMPGIRSKIIIDEQARSILPLLNLDTRKGDQS